MSRKTKRSKVLAHRSAGSDGGVDSGSMVVLTPTKTRRGKTIYKESQNDFLSEWIPHRSTYLSILLQLECLPEFLEKCSLCLQANSEIRCLCCFGHQAWCPPCADLGFTLNLGHCGDVCPHATPPGDQLTVVDSAGIFVHLVRPQTVFTFAVLDEFLIDALECKTSASSFYFKLRRLTNNAFPDSVPDHYHELMRVSRMWRDLINRKRVGIGHGPEREPVEGELAIFCPACPQPGVNLPLEWDKKYDRLPQDDIPLSDGLAYMVTNQLYQNHVENAANNDERSTCQNHRAVNETNTSNTHLRATGVGATACARHGCFVPHSVVDFYKGEQHKNIDYSICQAVNYKSDGIQKAIIIYDVACQWCKNFAIRVDRNPGLSLPDEMEIVAAIGKFHLSAHKIYCFPRYSLMFLKGARHIDGEILETLWAAFNKISPSARSMSLAHRQELYDDHMRDSNWKKLILTSSIEKTLSRKLKLAMQDVDETKVPFEELTPSMAEIHLSLLQSNTRAVQSLDSISWLIERISIEDAHNPTASQKVAIIKKRQKLHARIVKFNQMAGNFMANSELETCFITKDVLLFCPEKEGDTLNAEEKERIFWEVHPNDSEYEFQEDDSETLAEELSLLMPSSLRLISLKEAGGGNLINEEVQLRIGQANDCLERLRTHLGHRSIIFRLHLRSSTSVRSDTRSKQDLRRATWKINQDVQGYHRARESLIHLDASQDTIKQYQAIKPDQLGVSKDITEENRYGQGSDALPWFWRMGEVSWLKARARYHRWQEELEMKEWEHQTEESQNAGLKAYAAKQMNVWQKFREKVEGRFGQYMIVTI
ncbi:hypothetical protein EV363DRAFT_1151130 [Boletus edulis]|nr:hypothetical protein EV363DRAFT_1151130 [Boletus edulis]